MEDPSFDQRGQTAHNQQNAGTIINNYGTPPATPPATAATVPPTAQDSSSDDVDVFIITAKAEEYFAVYQTLHNPTDYQGTRSKPSEYSWTLGTIPEKNTGNHYRVVLATTHEQTNVSAAIATKETFERFHPRYVIFVGIAGSLKEWVKQGDIVIGNYVWGYGYGRVEQTGAYTPRHLFTVALDNALKSRAATFVQRKPDWWQSVGAKPIGESVPPAVHFGGIASGDMVIESIESAFGQAIVKDDSDLYAVAMEEHGAVQAVRQIQQTTPIGLMVVRGITDIPAGVITGEASETAPAAGHDVRKQWTEYATRLAASFVYQYVSGHLPYAADPANP